MSEQIDPLADSTCIYGQAGERLCRGQFFEPGWCCGNRDATLHGLPDPEMST